mgnify:CR=1 FL=1|tara:strand:+ start:8386 stop:10164 length:1779 start_codon:yes stop_codon:yes gene_type:complete
MCGISVIIKNDNNLLEKSIQDSLNLINHRGPDGQGIFIEGNIGFGHNRLSIQDLNPRSNQPMQYKDLTITFNGEIYNFLELKEELTNLGHTFETTSDTEVILAAYSEWGKNCVERFNGMWAFAIYDPKKSKVFISRDRFGKKPLHYLVLDDGIYIGSEIKQLLPILKKRRVNLKVLSDYLVLGISDHGEDTFISGIKRLNSGTSMFVCTQTLNINFLKYYDLGKELNKIDYRGNFQDLFNKAVALRLRSDAKIGMGLSGGIDSSCVAYSISENIGDKDFMAICASSGDEINDESNIAKELSDKLNLNFVKACYSTDQRIENIRRLIRIQDEPFPSASLLMQENVYKVAKDNGLKVMLGGQGGDETFLGYERYYPLILRYRDIFNVKKIRSITKHSRLSFLNVIEYIFFFRSYFVRKYVKIFQLKSILKDKIFENVNWSIFKSQASSYSDPMTFQVNEIIHFQLPHLLRYEDRTSMAYSIESRLPFLDYKVVEYALNLDLNKKINQKWTKLHLRESFNNLLGKIIYNKHKIGFEPPKAVHSLSKDEIKFIKESNFYKSFLKSFEKKTFRKINENFHWKIFILSIWFDELELEA